MPALGQVTVSDPSTLSWLDTVAPLFGVILGSFITYLATLSLESRRQKQEKFNRLFEMRKEFYLELLEFFKFDKDISDDELYLMVLKTELIGDEKVAFAIGKIFSDIGSVNDMNEIQLKAKWRERIAIDVVPKIRESLEFDKL